MLRHPSLYDLESSIDEKLTDRSITFHYSTNWQHPALILRFQSTIISVLFFNFTYTLHYISNDEN